MDWFVLVNQSGPHAREDAGVAEQNGDAVGFVADGGVGALGECVVRGLPRRRHRDVDSAFERSGHFIQDEFLPRGVDGLCEDIDDMVDEFVVRCSSTVDVAGDEWVCRPGNLHRTNGIGGNQGFDGVPVHEGEVVVDWLVVVPQNSIVNYVPALREWDFLKRCCDPQSGFA